MRKHVLSFALAFMSSVSLMAASAPTGALSGLFKINDAGDQVWISRGNLQYQASTNTFRFAPNQYDTIGAGNAAISASNTGWIDLFGYGTSGYNDIHPYKSELTFDGYGNGTENIAGTEFDWGVHNPISNGGNQAGIWRTLTREEWYYVIKKHYNYQATVNGVTGLIVLPDEFVNPGVTLQYSKGKFNENIISKTQWTQLENAGAIFLPAAGNRTGKEVETVGEAGFYWSSTTKSESTSRAMAAEFEEGKTIVEEYSQIMATGMSVRLVADRVIEDYHLSVNGTAITELNYTELSTDGSIVFEPATQTLTLTDANINGLNLVQNVIATDEAITLNLVGVNTITTTGGSGLSLAAGSTISGSGELVISASQGASRSALSFSDHLGIAGQKAYDANILYITTITDQTLSPAFSVAANNTVQFVKSNLQYNNKLDLFRFAKTAYAKDDEVADAAKGLWYSTLSWDTETWSEMTIYNSGNQSGIWRLLTADEWQYLFFQRDNALYKFSYGSIEDVYGLIILPDAWTLPSGLSFTVYPLLPEGPSDTENHYSAADWEKMDNAGAVFLPYFGNSAACSLWLPDEIDEDNVYYLFAKWGKNPNLAAESLKSDWNRNVRFVVGESTIESIDNVNDHIQASKNISNGQVFILRGNKTYTVTGLEVR